MLLILGLAALLIFAACNGGGDQEPTPTTAPSDTAMPPTEPPGVTDTGTPLSTAKPTIISPEEGDAVPIENRVDMIVEPDDLGGKELHVLVRPVPLDPNQDFWVLIPSFELVPSAVIGVNDDEKEIRCRATGYT